MERPRYGSVFRAGLFDGQVGIVTGGGSGIGRCIAHELSALGATVVLASRDRAKLEVAAKEIVEDGGKADVVPCDIRREDQVKALIATTVERHHKLDFVVNNGGGQFVSPVENLSLKGWQAVIDTNLTGTFLMSREATVQWMGEHGGAIVNIVAEMWRGMPMMGHSGAARAGVVNLTKTCALEWAQHRIRVNAVAPGIIRSSGFKNYPEPVLEQLKGIGLRVPAQRFGTESEISAAVTFLLSPAAAYITGETLCVDGALPLFRQPLDLPMGDPFEAFDGFHRPADLPPGFDGGAKGNR